MELVSSFNELVPLSKEVLIKAIPGITEVLIKGITEYVVLTVSNRRAAAPINPLLATFYGIIMNTFPNVVSKGLDSAGLQSGLDILEAKLMERINADLINKTESYANGCARINLQKLKTNFNEIKNIIISDADTTALQKFNDVNQTSFQKSSEADKTALQKFNDVGNTALQKISDVDNLFQKFSDAHKTALEEISAVLEENGSLCEMSASYLKDLEIITKYALEDAKEKCDMTRSFLTKTQMLPKLITHFVTKKILGVNYKEIGLVILADKIIEITNFLIRGELPEN